jgi:hypothetical protein
LQVNHVWLGSSPGQGEITEFREAGVARLPVFAEPFEVDFCLLPLKNWRAEDRRRMEYILRSL